MIITVDRSYGCINRLFCLSPQYNYMILQYWSYNKTSHTVTQWACCWWTQTEYEKRRQVTISILFTLSEQTLFECTLPLLRDRNLTEVSLQFHQYALYRSPLAVSVLQHEVNNLSWNVTLVVKLSFIHISWNFWFNVLMNICKTSAVLTRVQ